MLEALLGEIAQANFTALPWPESAREQAMEALRFLLSGSLTERPKENGTKRAVKFRNLAWCFVAGPDFRPIPARTWNTLEKLIDAGMVYFTPNTFFSRRRKTRDALRWLNALWVDVDDPAACDLDVLDRCSELGLPLPSLVVKTPHGLHVFWKIQRVRATEKALKLYSKVLRALAEAFGADVKAATPEHFLKIPRVILRFERVEYELRDFLVLLDDGYPTAAPGGRVAIQNILSHPAVQKLLEGVPEGVRNNTCFTLARAHRWSGYSYEETLQAMLEWNQRNRPPLRENEVRASVRSAYRGLNRPPAARWIRELSGMAFSYQIARRAGGDVKRPCGRPRVQEVARERFVALIWEAGGSLTTRDGRRKIAAQLGVSERTLNGVVAALVAEGLLSVSTRRLGRGNGAETTYAIANAVPAQNYNTAKNSDGETSREKAQPDQVEDAGTRLLENAIKCCFEFAELTEASGEDLRFFIELLVRHSPECVIEKIDELKRIKARDPTGFLVEHPRRWLVHLLRI
ncbi:primase-like protein [Thermodesulfitimonas autotrophica]|uniref:Primase-like protein n=1 Tax=Thermodesulfitimonas autotrophica TaxID=1894989 RepID=A0A3N5AXF1_9THEO|nr:primase C-terminal domain-containing protein [Thermodesulfitimonas autotrophica]RPF49617.1 primase-like protein [Thermodesulfitimonas autotrophica]